jgi:hypothetical protein
MLQISIAEVSVQTLGNGTPRGRSADERGYETICPRPSVSDLGAVNSYAAEYSSANATIRSIRFHNPLTALHFLRYT